ncbi:hypothetical protein K1T71_006079 [Dendrolimus kikuchii]|uniref:Uncharacterized protein n=1 Tax=Dendrolimus kikuchii TaxID=765133 RepID=A0ACC1D334_9NEOP|nr:hypothetical protein K1T71_006079 [Dendrolimus kikuchii]
MKRRNSRSVYDDMRYDSSDSSCNRKSTRFCKSDRYKESETNVILNKFLSILNDVKSSEKPKLSFNNNVIPEFDPLSKEQTMLVWITKIEECAEIYGWSEKEIIHYALPKLTGVAKTWYQGLPTLMHTWGEWKKKLIESFPCREDYAELLTEMLSKRVKYGESLEHYYYTKLNLLNRCKIYGKRAVDCILHGVDDRAIRVGAQAAQFDEPERILKYFRTVKVGQSRERYDGNVKIGGDRKNLNNITNRFQNSRFGTMNSNIRCFNCGEFGHPSFRCEKPIIKCTMCERMGHQAANCYKFKANQAKTETQSKDKIEKQVLELSKSDRSVDKYIFDIKINGKVVQCHVDLGSQCSLIKISKAKELGFSIKCPPDLPALRGIGANLTTPLGVVTTDVEVQGINEVIDIYVVEDYVLNYPALLGHSFTEIPNLTITKTPTKLIFRKGEPSKVHLECNDNFCIPKLSLCVIPVKSELPFNGNVSVRGSVRALEGNYYYLLSGEYNIKSGIGSLLAYNMSEHDITITKDSLLTRADKNDRISSNTVNCYQMSLDSLDLDEPIKSGETLNHDDRLKLQELLHKYKGCFAKSLKELGFTQVTEMVIELEDTEPVVYRPYRLSLSERKLVNDMVQEMMDSGIIRESSSAYASPIVLVQKKTGEKRLCVDYRALNRKTKKEHYPLPRIDDQLDQLAGNRLFTSLDLASGYYQIPICEESRHKTAFVTPDGQFEYNRMPFGLVNAPSVFQRTINKILHDAKIKYAIVYMDDILIPSKDVTEGLNRLEEVLGLLKQGGLTLRLSKCNFFLSTVDFLGFEVNYAGIRPEVQRIKNILEDKTAEIINDVHKNYKIKNGRVYRIVGDDIRANGQVERFNRTILDALSTCTHNKDDKSWDDYIYDIQVGINTTVHKTTQKSPSELLFGFNVTSRSEGILSPIIRDTTNVINSDNLNNVRDEASSNIKTQQLKDIERFNSRRKSGKGYKVGDLVRIERQVPHDGKSQKLVIKFQGPYRVMKVLPNDRYVVEDTPMTRKQGRRYEAVVALDKMQPWLSFSRDFESSDNDVVNDNGNELDFIKK